MHSVCEILPEYYILDGLPEVEITKVVEKDPSIVMVIAGRQGVAIEKHSHFRLRRATGHVTTELSESLKVPLLVVPPNVPTSHICPVMAEMQIQEAEQS